VRVDESATVSQVREALSAEAERVMAESKPTPTQAEIDAIVSGEAHLDEKVTPDNPEMPPLGAQEELLANAQPDPLPPPPDEKPPPGTEPPLSPPPAPEEPPPDPVAAAAEAQRRQAAAADPKAPYNTRTVPRQ
jgi:hypothetical protein